MAALPDEPAFLGQMTKLQPGEVYEHQLLEAVWCDAVPSGAYEGSRPPPNDIDPAVEYLAWAMRAGMIERHRT